MNLTREIITDFISQRYPEPILKTWNPSEYDMKYIYNTPRRLKKLEKVRESNNLKLKFIHDKEVHERNSIFDIINSINNFPQIIKNLFYQLIVWVIEDHERLVREHQNTKEHLISTYGQKQYELISYYDNVMYHIKKRYTIREENYKEEFLKSIENYCSHNAKEFKEYINSLDNNEVIEIFNNFLKYKDLGDKLHTSPSVPELIKMSAFRIDEISKAIIKIMGGIPDGTEIPPTWGVGGEFNAILLRGSQRVSFKSFVAGGWNIQRRHIRYRITELT